MIQPEHRHTDINQQGGFYPEADHRDIDNFLIDFPFDVLDAAAAGYHGEQLFGGELYGQSLVQEFGKIFLSKTSGTEQTVGRDYCKELLQLCSELSQGDRENTENSEEKISQLSQCFSTLIAEESQDPDPEFGGLLGDLSVQEAETVGRAVTTILSNQHSSSVFLTQPLLDLLLDILPLDLVPRTVMRQLVSMFDQEDIEADQAVASLLSLLSSLSPHPPLPDCQTIIEKLQTSSYCSLSVLLRLEEERRPSLTPIPVDQITEETVYERVNLLSQCSSLSVPDILRYALHVSTIDTDCALHLLQNFVLELPLPCLLYFSLAHLSAQPDCGSCEGELRDLTDLQFLSLLARAASLHIPGWSEAWSLALSSHPLLVGTLTEALKVTNERRLSKVANIVGAHKAADSLELLSLADFLAAHLGLSHSEAAAFFQRQHSLPGLARLVSQHPGLALSHLPLIIELGDVGRQYSSIAV